jgi:antitoxin HicB
MIKTLRLAYQIDIEEEKEGGYVLRFVDFPEAITQAETIEQALYEAYDCLEEAIAHRVISKLAIPKPVNLSFLECMKIDRQHNGFNSQQEGLL